MMSRCTMTLLHLLFAWNWNSLRLQEIIFKFVQWNNTINYVYCVWWVVALCDLCYLMPYLCLLSSPYYSHISTYSVHISLSFFLCFLILSFFFCIPILLPLALQPSVRFRLLNNHTPYPPVLNNTPLSSEPPWTLGPSHQQGPSLSSNYRLAYAPRGSTVISLVFLFFCIL